MGEHTCKVVPALVIPASLIGEVRSKLAYVDEHITHAEVVESGDLIVLSLNQALDAPLHQALEDKVQRVVQALVKRVQA